MSDLNELLEGFSLIGQECRYISVFKQSIVFSKLVAKELGYPQYVQFLTNPEKMMLAVRPCEEDDSNAVAFTAVGSGDVRIKDNDLREAIESIKSAESGYRVKGTFYEDHGLYIFDFNDCYEDTRRRGRRIKEDGSEEILEEEELSEDLDEMPDEENAEPQKVIPQSQEIPVAPIQQQPAVTVPSYEQPASVLSGMQMMTR